MNGLVNEETAAKILGISRISLRRGRSEGPRADRMPVIPYVKLGRAIRYELTTLEAVIAENRHTPMLADE